MTKKVKKCQWLFGYTSRKVCRLGRQRMTPNERTELNRYIHEHLFHGHWHDSEEGYWHDVFYTTFLCRACGKTSLFRLDNPD